VDCSISGGWKSNSRTWYEKVIDQTATRQSWLPHRDGHLMSEPVITVDSVAKVFRIGRLRQRHTTLRDALSALPRTILGSISSMRHSRANRFEEFWALSDVSFSVTAGEVVGIVGHNGAGKSTLLKILSRITEPTSGTVTLRGRVGSLLEVGTGFHSELTGLENIYLSGAILGMRRREINQKLNDIIAFAEVERFIETPVKHYSSGMYLRLAFAVAAYLDPEILLVDEVLAVGDAKFQRKCLGKMEDVASMGRTVLLVSHNTTAIQSLCDRVIWLKEGRVIMDDATAEVLPRYLSEIVVRQTEQHWPSPATAPGNDEVRLHRASVRPLREDPAAQITVRTGITLEFEYWNMRAGAHLNLSMSLYREQGVIAFTTTSLNDPYWHGRAFPEGLFRSSCIVPGDLLNDGLHRIELLVVRDEGVVVHRFTDLLMFDVQDERPTGTGWHGRWTGAVRPALEWQTQRIDGVSPEVNSAAL
jgi:lipopolysaccharide transport system ATP-binding protein